MQILRWLLYFYFFWLALGQKSDCLDGAKKSPIGEEITSSHQIEIDTSTPELRPIDLPTPSKTQNLRGRRFIYLQEEFIYD